MNLYGLSEHAILSEFTHPLRSGHADDQSNNDLWVGTSGWKYARSLSVEKLPEC